MNEKTRRILLAVFAGLLLLAGPATAQTQTPEETTVLEEWQSAELRSLVEVVRAALRGQLVPTEDPFELHPDFLKGADGNTYVPFTLTIDPAKITASSVAMYLFVTEHQMPAAPAAATTDETEAESAPELPAALFEDGYFIDVSAARSAGGPVHISRAFTVPGGPYDVYVGVRDSAGQAPEDETEPDSATLMMLKEEVEVPDLWTPNLQTSTVIVADVIEPLTQPLTPEQQISSPYTLGTTRIVPKEGTEFAKNGELALVFLVYNPELTAQQKPDVTIEYNFHATKDGAEEFFNKTNPQQFNGQTLPPGFDMMLGHQIVAGQSVPLTLFPAGAYRLEIKVTDNISGGSVTNNVNFTVLQT